MSHYVVGVDGLTDMDEANRKIRGRGRPVHVWTHGGREPWNCTAHWDGPGYGRPEAACGEGGMDAYVVDLDQPYDSIEDFIWPPCACQECANALADRHNLPVLEVEQ